MKLKWRLVLVLGILGVVFTFNGVPDWICLNKPANDITELWDVDYTDLKIGDHVCMDITLVWDQIGTQVEQSKTFGVTTSEKETGRYYLLPFCQEEDDGYIYPTPYLLARVGSSMNSIMDSQIAKTESWWETEEDFDTVPTCSIHLDGKLEKLPRDVRKQLESSLDPEERLEDYMLPMLFVPIAAPGAVKAISLIGIVCLMATLAILAFILKSASEAKPAPFGGMPRNPNPDYAPHNPDTAEDMELDFLKEQKDGTGGAAENAGQPNAAQTAGAAAAFATSTFETSPIPPIPGYSYGAGQQSTQQPVTGAYGAGQQSTQQPITGSYGAGQQSTQQPVTGAYGAGQQSTQQPVAGVYGASQQSTQQPVTGAYGAGQQSTQQPVAPMSFGASTPVTLPLSGSGGAATQGGNSFGSQAVQLPLGNSYGSSVSQQPAGNSFTGASSPVQPLGGGILGATPAQPTGGGILGATPAQPAGGGILGATPVQPAGGGILGATPAQPLGGGILGATPTQPAYTAPQALGPSPSQLGQTPELGPVSYQQPAQPPAGEANGAGYSDNDAIKNAFMGAFSGNPNDGNN